MRAFAASRSRLRGGAVVSSDLRSLREAVVTSSTATRNAGSLARDGLLKPLSFLTNCSAAARISSSVTGGSKLKRGLMFLHMHAIPILDDTTVQARSLTELTMREQHFVPGSDSASDPRQRAGVPMLRLSFSLLTFQSASGSSNEEPRSAYLLSIESIRLPASARNRFRLCGIPDIRGVAATVCYEASSQRN